MRVNNPKIKHIKSFDAYEVLFEYVEPANIINRKEGRTINQLTVNEVAVIKSHVGKDFQTVLNIFHPDIEMRNIRIYDLYQFQKWIIKELEVIMKREERLKITDTKLIGAGANDLQKYGVLNTIDTIAQRYSQKPQDVGNWNYNYVFILMEKIVMEAQIEKRVRTVKRKK
jgi:hypothetical protein